MKIKTPINTEFVTLKTPKIPLKLSNSRKCGVTQIRTLKVNDKNDCTIFTAPIFYLMIYQNSLDFAQQLDREDPIATELLSLTVKRLNNLYMS